MQHAQEPTFDADAYLAWEETQAEKHEFLAGETFAMVGAPREHVIVSLNLAASLKQRLRGTPCQVYIADMKLRVEEADAFFYPDVMVSCDQDDRRADLFLSHPTLVAEVLSDSTTAFDRGDKFAAYRRLASLKEYVIVDINALRVECYRRTPDDEWLLHDYTGEENCEFSSLGLIVPLAEIFEDVEP